MNRILNTSFVVIFLIVLALCAQERDKPNILWITSEDNNVSWVGAYGNTHVQTPNIDNLASEGFKYTEAYANAPVCAPSRSTWITGLYAISTGTQHMRSRNLIPHNKISYYPDLLKENGYYTANANKTDYNIGGRDDKDCWDNATHLNWDNLKQKQPYFQIINLYESHESRAQGDLENIDYDFNSVKLKAYHPDLETIRKNYAKYHDALLRMDEKVGNILEELEDNGLHENTIVIYTSDHGGVMPRSKRYLFNSGLHCPLIIRIPEKYKSLWPSQKIGSSIERLVSFVDMPKTWLSLAKIKCPDYYQGNIFLGNEIEDEEKYHFAFRGRMDERYDEARAVHNKQFLYIKNYMPWAPWIQHLEYQWKIKAQVAWEEYVHLGKATGIQCAPFYPKTNVEELYDMKNDPDCTNNLISNTEYKEIANELRLALREWQLDINDTGLLLESEMNKRAKQNKLTVMEMAQDRNLYPLEKLINAADLALSALPKNKIIFEELIKQSDPGLRYWGAIGLMRIGDYSKGKYLSEDTSDEVKTVGAWMMISEKQYDEGFRVISSMLENNSNASLFILNVLDWVDEDLKIISNKLANFDYEKGKDLDKMRNFLIQKWIK